MFEIKTLACSELIQFHTPSPTPENYLGFSFSEEGVEAGKF